MPDLGKFTQRLVAIIAPEFEERDRHWQQAITAIERRHAAQGMLQSGNTIVALDRHAADELRVRAARLFNLVTQVAQAQGLDLSAETAEAIKAELRAQLDRTYTPMRRVVIEHVQRLGLRDRAAARGTEELDFARQNVETKLATSLDLLADQAQARKEAPAAATSISISGGYIGAIQTGANSAATVSVTLTGSDREFIRRVLTEFEEVLQAAQQKGAAELVEIVSDGLKELERETPNTIRLGTILQTLANACQGIAGAPAVVQLAYDAMALLRFL